MYSAMKNGTFKVFSNQTGWFEEFRQYYMKDGDVVKEKDDLMAASRYGFCSMRHGSPKMGQMQTYDPSQDEEYYMDDLVGY